MERIKTNEGVNKREAARGQTLVTPVGMDNSDYGGPASKEVGNKAKLGGGMDNLSHSLPGKDD
jgi:hypothetical protein